MRKTLFALVTMLGLALGQSVSAAEVIRDFNVQAALTRDRQLTVTETITYDFGDAEKHGIYRFIPNVYDRNGAKYKLNIQFTEARMDGAAIPWVVTDQGDNINIRIGDADKLITGQHTYVFSYRTDKAINDFPDHRELYWNATGNGWEVAIEKVSFKLTGPAPATQTACYVGIYGSTATECTIKPEGNAVTFTAKRALDAYEGLTVVTAFSLDAIRALTFKEKFAQFIEDNIWSLLPLFTVIVMFLIWRKWGKEPVGRGTVIAQYDEPQKLPPALMSALMEQKVSNRAVSSTILDLARRGFMKIKFEGNPEKRGWLSKPPEITFVKIKDPAVGELLVYEDHIWKAIFEGGKTEVKPKDLEGKAYIEIKAARRAIQKELQDRKWFTKSPTAVRALWGVIAGLVIGQGIFLAAIFGGLYILSSIVSAVIVFAFGWQMPQMTKAGAILKEECEGLKLFLSVTEKARLEFTDAPSRQPEQFARYLPAAVAFGVEEQWAGQFESLEVTPPDYMEGNFATWNALAFAHAMNQINTYSAASMYNPPSSAGSGSSGFSGGGSGGGFGGGGGGSW